MKLQVAIDRVSFERAEELIEIFNGVADIIEVGTSLIKDYGLLRLKELSLKITKSEALADIKTNDEGAYEFNMGYKQGFDILTVMGSSSLETIEKCYKVSQSNNKKMMIDLLECSDEKIKEISKFRYAIYCLHTSIDKKRENNILDDIEKFKNKFPNIKHIAIAGGINLDVLREISHEDIDIVVIGTSITASDNPLKAIAKFKEEII